DRDVHLRPAARRARSAHSPHGGRGEVNAPESLEHYVSKDPWDPSVGEALTPEQERFYRASQWQIMWWKFRRHRVAVAAGVILLVFYASTLVSELIAPYHLNTRDTKHIYAPPQAIHLMHEGRLVGPFVYGYRMRLNLETLKRDYSQDPGALYKLRFFCLGDEYRFWNLVEARLHFVCPAPVRWSLALVDFGLTIVLGLLDLPGLARAVRSKLLALREEDFATAAVLMGASPARVSRKHLLPSFASHLIASATRSVPAMILGETALSFLGLGLRPPITSSGVLLNEAQNINVVALYPWLLLSVVPVFIVVLAFNFFGDGLRDAADPYSSAART